MKRRVFMAALVFVAIAVVGIVVQRASVASGADAPGVSVQPRLILNPPLVKLNTASRVLIMGSGFQAGQELNVLLLGADGAESNVYSQLSPTPQAGKGIVADAYGNFAYLLTLGGLTVTEAEGVFTIRVTDLNFNTVAVAPIGFADPDGRSQVASYPQGKPDYVKNPTDPRPLPWTAPFFEYPKRPAK